MLNNILLNHVGDEQPELLFRRQILHEQQVQVDQVAQC